MLFSPKKLTSYSQLAEDIYLLQNFINLPREDITAVEVGAFDGVTYSNTLLLEREFNARVVLIEPSAMNSRWAQLHRPKASIHRLAIADSFGIAEFCGSTAVAAVRGAFDESYEKEWALDQMQPAKVMKAPLSSVLDIENLGYVDFLSIDVQGSELSVLKTMDWNIPVGVICAEFEGRNSESEKECRNILAARGFEQRCRLHISEFWWKPDYFRRELLFDPSKQFPLKNFHMPYFAEHTRKEIESFLA